MGRLACVLMTIMLVVVSLFAAVVAPGLRVSDDHQLFLKSSNKQYTDYLDFKASYPLEQGDVLVILQGEILSVDTVRGLYAATAQLQQLNSVANVASVLTVPWVDRKAKALLDGDTEARSQVIEKLSDARYLPSRLVSDNFRSTLFTVTLNSESADNKEALSAAIEGIRSVLNETVGQQLSIKLAGFPALRYSLVQQISRDSITFGATGLLLSIAAALFIFGSWRLVGVSVVGPVLAIVCTMAFMSLADIRVNSLNQMVFVLVLIITYSDSVHLTDHIRKLHSSGYPILHVIGDTFKVVLPACGMTSLTTAVGFGSLMLADSFLVKQFGLLCAVGSIVGFAVMLLCTPLMVVALRCSSEVNAPGRWRFFLPASKRHDMTVILVGVAFTFWVMFTMVQLRPGYTVGENLPHDSEFKQASQVADTELGGALPLTIMVDWINGEAVTDGQKMRDLRMIQNQLRQQTPDQWVSVVNLLRFSSGINSATRLELLPDSVVARFLNRSESNALISTTLKISSTEKLNENFNNLDSVLHNIQSQLTNVTLEINGLLPLVNSSSQQMISDLVKSLTTTFVVISVLLFLLFRSWTLALLLLVPNVAPIASVASVLVWSGTPLQFSSVIVFSICLGIVVDDSIHLTHRYLYYRKSALSNEESVAKAQLQTGRVLIMSSVILVSGLLALLCGSNPTVALMGKLLIVALVVALVFDLIVLPALLRRFHRGGVRLVLQKANGMGSKCKV